MMLSRRTFIKICGSAIFFQFFPLVNKSFANDLDTKSQEVFVGLWNKINVENDVMEPKITISECGPITVQRVIDVSGCRYIAAVGGVYCLPSGRLPEITIDDVGTIVQIPRIAISRQIHGPHFDASVVMTGDYGLDGVDQGMCAITEGWVTTTHKDWPALNGLFKRMHKQGIDDLSLYFK